MVARLNGRFPWAAPQEAAGHEATSPAVRARALAWLYTAGPTLALLTLVLPNSRDTNDVGILALIGAAYVGATFTVLWGPHLRSWALSLLAALGSLLISGAIYFQGNDTGSYGYFYLWVTLYAFYFETRRVAFGHLALIGSAFAAVLAVDQPPNPIERWLITLGSLVIAGLLIRALRDNVSQLMTRLSDAARTDPVTDLLNRRGFEERFDQELARARRGGQPLSILLGDVDHFKKVNDRLGHEAGDNALRRLSAVVESSRREIDTAARIGGEEFALILPETDEQGADRFAGRLRAAVRAAFAEQPVQLTISFGIATFPIHGTTREALLRAGDQALYAAKGLGRDRSTVHSAEVSSILEGLEQRESSDGETHLMTALTLAEALDLRISGTARHSQTVGRYAEMMARALGLPPSRVERVRLAGILHDVGKIAVSDHILLKPGPWSDDEALEIRKHPEVGARLLGSASLNDIRSWVIAHHERPDGNGYPYGLTGDVIPLEAKIVAVADAYEAMTADRVYRPALRGLAAREELRRCAGTQFDPQVVEIFLDLLGAETVLTHEESEPAVASLESLAGPSSQ
jgi:diguanylate cyclase (GGDEF)-like protein/putative nucleotidyltransferase with HDIG domain